MRLSDSDLAAVMGVAPRPFGAPAETALTVWERLRTGRPDQWADAKRLSSALEPVLAGVVDAAHGLTVVKVALWHTPDQWAVEGPPRWLFVSAQRRMAEAGVDHCRTVVLLAGCVLKVGGMRAESAFQAELAQAESAFRAALETPNAPPEPSDEADLDVEKRLWPRQPGSVRALEPEAAKLWAVIVELRKRSRETSRRRKTLEARMRRLLGGAEIGLLPNRKRLAVRKWGSGTKLVEL